MADVEAPAEVAVDPDEPEPVAVLEVAADPVDSDPEPVAVLVPDKVAPTTVVLPPTIVESPLPEAVTIGGVPTTGMIELDTAGIPADPEIKLAATV